MRALFEQNLKWKIDGSEQAAHEADYGNEPAEDKHRHLFVEVLSKSGGDTVDRLIITVVPRSTKTKWDAWYPTEKADMSWLAELPPMFSWIEITVGPDGFLPRPDRNFNPFLYAVPHAIDLFYHPGAAYEMRSYATPNNHGGQVCYDSSGHIITSGMSSGSADREAPAPAQLNGTKHRDADVKPFIWAAQLDGNPVEGIEGNLIQGILPYTNMTAPMLYKGDYINKYLEVRPPVPNNKPMLTPGAMP